MKKIFTLLFVAFVASAAQAQGFASIEVVGALTRVSVRGTPNELQAVVPNNFDLSNVVINYVPEDGAELDGTLPTDFSTTNTQDITLKKTDNTGSRTWHLTIKKINPSPLPLENDFGTGITTAAWTPATIGWAFSGIDTGQASVARYGTGTVTFIAAFNESPQDVSYTLNSLGAGFSDGDQFDVDASADGITWRTIRSFVGKSTGVPTATTDYTTALNPTDRYVRWVYVKRTVNLNLKKFSITKGDKVEDPGLGASLNISNTGYGLGKFSVNNALQLYTKASSSTRSALELHAVVAEDFDFSNPANNVLEIASGYTANPTTLPTNFATPQTVTFTKTGQDPNVWTIYVKPIKPATTLPLELSFNSGNESVWDEETIGWATAGTNANRAATVAFDSDKTSFIVGFTQQAISLSYDLVINAPSTTIPDDASFEIRTSDESAATWNLLYKYDKDNQIPSNDAESINHQLSLTSDVRYIKFLYANRGTGGKNLNLNNIVISNVTTSIQQPNAKKPSVFYQPVSGEIVFTQAVSKVEVYDLLGGLTAVYNNPGNQISIAGAKGVALLRITLNDGTVISQKALK